MKKHIVCFGDSNTHGYRASDGGRFDEQERWTCLLAGMLGPEYLVLEEGLSGRTTCFSDPLNEGLSGLDYLIPCLFSHEPVALLILMLGTNDTKERFGVSAACIALGLRRLIARARCAEGCWLGEPNILVITPKNIAPAYAASPVAATMGRGCAEKAAQLGAFYEETARQTGCHYFDANTVVGDYNSIDHMHLTAEGHRQLAQALAALVPGLLASP